MAPRPWPGRGAVPEGKALVPSKEAVRPRPPRGPLPASWQGMTPEGLKKVTTASVDLAYSRVSWGFHYPVDTYSSVISRVLKPNGVLIIDLRWGTHDKGIKEFGNDGLDCEVRGKAAAGKAALVHCVKPSHLDI